MSSAFRIHEKQIVNRLVDFNWLLISAVLFFVFVGIALLYSAAQGNMEPWAGKQLYVALIFIPFMLFLGLVDVRFFYRSAYPLYILGIILLIIAEILGHKAMGAQRWIRIGFINFQPSELMKLFVIVALARYFHNVHSGDIGKIRTLIAPSIIVFIPAILILKQPNLGTALITIMIGGTMFFLAGVRTWKFLTIIGSTLVALPIVWKFMHDYQKKRVLTFLDPESDPLGAGYNILQSMIAIGSGGFSGKGFLNGTQSQLSFLPEKQTDFVFTILAEEFGFLGVLALFAVSCLIIVYGHLKTMTVNNQFSRLIMGGIITLFALHVVINTAMIAGAIPVVGTPFPFFSYGGSNLIAMLLGFGLFLSASSKYNRPLN
jgi:rod shape determining protein RodA